MEHFTGTAATASKLLESSKEAPLLLHVATHAFYSRPSAKPYYACVDEAMADISEFGGLGFLTELHSFWALSPTL